MLIRRTIDVRKSVKQLFQTGMSLVLRIKPSIFFQVPTVCLVNIHVQAKIPLPILKFIYANIYLERCPTLAPLDVWMNVDNKDNRYTGFLFV